MCHCRVIDDFQHRLITKYPSIYISLPNDFNFLRSKCFSMKLSFYSFVKKLISLFAAVQSLLNFSRRNRSDPLAPMLSASSLLTIELLLFLIQTVNFLPHNLRTFSSYSLRMILHTKCAKHGVQNTSK